MVNGKLGKISINGQEIKLIDNDFSLELQDIPDTKFSIINNFSATVTCEPLDIEEFNNVFDKLYINQKCIKLKEKLLKKYLMKLVKKEIDILETCKYIYTLNKFEENELIILDKSKFKLKQPDYITL